MPYILAKAVDRLAWKKTSASSAPGPGRLYSRQGTDDDDECYALYVYVRISDCVYVYLFKCTSLFMPACVLYAYHRCQPSRNRAGNPANLVVSRIPAFFPKHPAFLGFFGGEKNRRNSR